MSREGIWQKGSNPQYAHAVVRRIGYAAGRSLVLQDALASQDPLVAYHELFHINGNALFDFKSPKFGQYLIGELFNATLLENSARLTLFLFYSVFSCLLYHSLLLYYSRVSRWCLIACCISAYVSLAVVAVEPIYYFLAKLSALGPTRRY